jgi:urease accessory protein
MRRSKVFRHQPRIGGATTVRRLLATLTVVLACRPQEAMAHHMLGGELPSSMLGGFLSGLAHPVLGPDHLAFILAIGILAAALVRGSTVPLVFLSASLAGCVLRLTSISVAGGEVAVAVSVIAAGVFLAVDRNLRRPLLVAGVALAGALHGYVYGESIVGTERTPIVGYLLGLAVIQCAVAMAAFAVARRLHDGALPGRDIAMRAAGIAVGLIGVVALSLAL